VEYADKICKNAEMNWDDVRFFIAVAREGSVTRAAEALGVNYTTVARRISALENRLNTRLFDRIANGHVMTAAASSVLDRALAMEKEMIALDRTVFGQDEKLSGKLRLATIDIAATYLVFPHFADFLQRYPDIELEISVSDAEVDISRREADIVLRMVEGEPPQDAIGVHVADVEFSIYGSTTYLATRPDLNTASTQILRWLLVPGQRELPALFRSDWITKIFPLARPGMRIDSMVVMLSALRHGFGICGLPRFVGDAEPELAMVPNTLAEQKMSLWLLHHADLRKTSRVRVLRDFLRDCLLLQRGTR